MQTDYRLYCDVTLSSARMYVTDFFRLYRYVIELLKCAARLPLWLFPLWVCNCFIVWAIGHNTWNAAFFCRLRVFWWIGNIITVAGKLFMSMYACLLWTLLFFWLIKESQYVCVCAYYKITIHLIVERSKNTLIIHPNATFFAKNNLKKKKAYKLNELSLFCNYYFLLIVIFF